MKTRNKNMPNQRLADYRSTSAGGANAGGGSGGGLVEGKYDEINLQTTPVWMHLPGVLFEQLVYDRDLGEVVKVETPWFRYTNHFTPKGSVACSAGPYKDKACWPCALRQKFIDDGGEWKDSPYGATSRFVFPVTIAERVYNAPIFDKTGAPIKKKKGGGFLTRFQPLGHLHPKIQSVEGLESKVGHKAHWGVSTIHLAELQSLELKLQDSCRGCCADLVADTFVCQECFTDGQPIGRKIKGSGLAAFRASRSAVCGSCGAKNSEEHEHLIPQVRCESCDVEGDPRGSISDFDLLLARVNLADKNWSIDVVDKRLAGSDPELQTPEYIAIDSNPLDLEKIFVGSIREQEYKIPENRRHGLSSSYGAYERKTEDSAHEDVADDNIPY